MNEAAYDESAHQKSAHDGGSQLVRMANDIGNFFRAEPAREDAIIGIGKHIAHYWTQRMRDKLGAHLQGGGLGLDELPREAFLRIAHKP